VVLIFTGRLLAEGMVRLGQPAVMGELLAGILLGPSIFGTLWPDGQAALFPDVPAQKAMINAVAQFGILMLLLLAGMETDIGLIRKVRKAAASASLGASPCRSCAAFCSARCCPTHCCRTRTSA